MIENIHQITAADTVYIAGPMTGLPNSNRRAFYVVQDHLEEHAGPYCILNPARQPDGLTYQEYMRRALADLKQATAVVFLRGWEQSRGALYENLTARFIGLRLLREHGAECPENGVLFIANNRSGLPLHQAAPWAEVRDHA